MASIRCQVIVEFGDVRIEFGWSGIGEGESRDVIAVAHRRIVRQWITVKDRQRCRINAGLLRTVPESRAKWVQILKIGVIERERTVRPTSLILTIVTLISQKPVAKALGRHKPGDNRCFVRPLSLVSGEDKHPVLDDRAANGSSERIPHKMGRYIRIAAQQLRPLVKKAVGLANFRSVVFIERSMKLVGPALGHQ